MGKKKPKWNFPDRKISDTFLEFAKPLLDVLGPDALEDQMGPPLKISWMVWNAVVFTDVAKKDHSLDLLRSSIKDDAALQDIVEALIDRKRTLFGDDDRVIGEYELYRKDGEIRLRAEARNPL